MDTQEQIQQLDRNIQTIAGWVKTHASNLQEYAGDLEEVMKLARQLKGATIELEHQRSGGGDISSSSIWDLTDTPDAGTCPIGSVLSVNALGDVICVELPHDDVFRVADIAARDALTIGDGDDEVSDGDIVEVANDNGQTTKYVYDETTGTWLKFNGGKNVIRTGENVFTALSPVHMDGGGFALSQGTDALSAEFLMVGTGQATENDICDFPAHGLTVGEYYVTSPTTPGGIVPLSTIAAGEPYQLLFKVPNADQIAIDVQPLTSPEPTEFRDHAQATGGETTTTFNHTLTDNTLIYRDNGRLQILGLHYTYSGDTVTWLNSTLVVDEYVAAVTLTGVDVASTQAFTPGAGASTITYVGTLPTDPSFIMVHRDNGRLQDPSTYTITGNTITFTVNFVAGEYAQITTLN